jgi:hypothetical protein
MDDEQQQQQQAAKRSSELHDQDLQSVGGELGPPTGKRRRIGLACNACRVRKSR